MGLSIACFKFLLEEKRIRGFYGSVLQLGRQDVFFTYEQANAAALEAGVLINETEIGLSPKPEYRSKGYLSDLTVFKMLGFEEVFATDVSNYEAPDFLSDLNIQVPEKLSHGEFDMVFDGGTIEHVFHLPNAFINIHRFLKVGGRIMHFSPTSNYVDHGFYMLCPTLFFDYYSANKYEINAMYFYRQLIERRDGKDRWEMMNYVAGSLRRIAFGGLDSGMYLTICVATKKPQSMSTQIPQQTRYVDVWNSSSSAKKPIKKKPWYRPIKKLYDLLRKGMLRPSTILFAAIRLRSFDEIGLRVDKKM